MTPAEFARALRSTRADPNSASVLAAYKVLVDGLGVRAAAREVGLSPTPVSVACRRIRRVATTCPTCGRDYQEDDK